MQRVDFSPVWVLNESSNSWSEMMYSYIGCTLHNWMRPTTSTKLYSSVSSITISLQFGVVWASFALCGPPRWGQLLRLLHHHPLLFGVVHGLALLYVGHHHVLQLQTQPLTLLNLCVFILQKNFHWGPNVSIWGYLKCSLGRPNVPIWGYLMCQFWGGQMCWGLVIHNRSSTTKERILLKFDLLLSLPLVMVYAVVRCSILKHLWVTRSSIF